MNTNVTHKDLIHFKDELLGTLNNLSIQIMDENAEKLSEMQKKLDQMTKNCSELQSRCDILTIESNDAKRISKEIINLCVFRENIDSSVKNNSSEINRLHNDLQNAIYKYDKIFTSNLLFPGLIGDGCKFQKIQTFFDFVHTQVTDYLSYKENQNISLKNYKERLENTIKKFNLQIEGVKISFMDYCSKSLKEAEERFKEDLKMTDSNMNLLRVENSNYALELNNLCKNLSIDWNKLLNIKQEITKQLNDTVYKFENLQKSANYEFNSYKEEFKVIKTKFNELSEFIKDVRFRKNLGKDLKVKEFMDMSKKLNFNKSSLRRFQEHTETNENDVILVRKNSNKELEIEHEEVHHSRKTNSFNEEDLNKLKRKKKKYGTVKEYTVNEALKRMKYKNSNYINPKKSDKSGRISCYNESESPSMSPVNYKRRGTNIKKKNINNDLPAPNNVKNEEGGNTSSNAIKEKQEKDDTEVDKDKDDNSKVINIKLCTLDEDSSKEDSVSIKDNDDVNNNNQQNENKEGQINKLKEKNEVINFSTAVKMVNESSNNTNTNININTNKNLQEEEKNKVIVEEKTNNNNLNIKNISPKGSPKKNNSLSKFSPNRSPQKNNQNEGNSINSEKNNNNNNINNINKNLSPKTPKIQKMTQTNLDPPQQTLSKFNNITTFSISKESFELLESNNNSPKKPLTTITSSGKKKSPNKIKAINSNNNISINYSYFPKIVNLNSTTTITSDMPKPSSSFRPGLKISRSRKDKLLALEFLNKSVDKLTKENLTSLFNKENKESKDSKDSKDAKDKESNSPINADKKQEEYLKSVINNLNKETIKTLSDKLNKKENEYKTLEINTNKKLSLLNNKVENLVNYFIINNSNNKESSPATAIKINFAPSCVDIRKKSSDKKLVLNNLGTNNEYIKKTINNNNINPDDLNCGLYYSNTERSCMYEHNDGLNNNIIIDNPKFSVTKRNIRSSMNNKGVKNLPVSFLMKKKLKENLEGSEVNSNDHDHDHDN